jgi:2,4-dichlorophenol 6-monooxygenase
LVAAWGNSGNTTHRTTLLSIGGRVAQRQQKLQHISFECATLDDLAAYGRLKNQGIEPLLAVHHGASTSFYYEDPDHNRVELTNDHATASGKAYEDLESSPVSSANAMGRYLDPKKMIAARGRAVRG